MPGGQYPAVLAGQELTADLLQAFSPYTAWKTGTTPRASTVTLTQDPDLVIPVVAGATYDIRGVLGYTADGPISGGGAGGISFTLAAPSGSSGGFTAAGWALGSSLVAGFFPWTAFGAAHSLNGDGATPCSAFIEGTLIVGTTAASVALWWCQAGADGTSTVLLAGSKLTAQRTS